MADDDKPEGADEEKPDATEHAAEATDDEDAASEESDAHSSDAESPGKGDEDGSVETASEGDRDGGDGDGGDGSDDGGEDAPPPSPAGPPPAAWGAPILRVDQAWTRFETYLAAAVLGLEILALSLWVVLKGMSTPADSESAAGIVFRAIFGAVVLGMIPFLALKKKGERAQRWGAIIGTFIGFYIARFWVTVGVDYTSNLLNWYQQASTLTLFGGLRGIGTRLTLLLALIGGSLATARGKHITIDLVTRFLSDKARLPVVVIGWVTAAIICLAGSWGFFDHIAIENFGANAEATRGEKIKKVAHELGEGFFVFRKQMKLDLKSTPHIVFRSEPYADWFNGAEWKEWLRDEGFAERYGEEAYQSLLIPEEDTRAPIVVIPGKGEPRGELIHAANLVFPIGLLIIAIRFLIRSLLAISRHVSVDPEEGSEFTTDKEAKQEGAT